jgi:hypothetical protein
MVPGSSKTTAGGGVEAGVRGSSSIREQISGAGRQKRHACKNKARATAPIKKNADCDNTCFVFMELCPIDLTPQHGSILNASQRVKAYFE